MPELRVARSELILGAQAGGQAARAEAIAVAWLALSSGHEAIYVATAQDWDSEMRERVARHRRRAAAGEARLRTAEEPLALAHALGTYSRPGTLVVVDCLTLWLTALMMRTAEHEHLDDSLPPGGRAGEGARGAAARADSHPLPGGAAARPPATMADAIAACAGPLVLLGHARGELPRPGRDARQFADSLGRLDQQAAAACERVTLVSGGLAMVLKGAA